MSVTSITTDNPDSEDPDRTDTSANLTSVTFGSTTFGSDALVQVSDVSATNDTGIYWGKGDSQPSPTTTANVMDDLDITTGKANNVAMNLMFEKPITDSNGELPDVAIFEIAEGSQSDSWTVEAIVGGTAASPVFGGTAYTFTQNMTNGFADTGHQIQFRLGAQTLNQDIYGIGLDFQALGLDPNTDTLLGVRVTTSGGDPNLVVGIIPAPAALPAGLALLRVHAARAGIRPELDGVRDMRLRDVEKARSGPGKRRAHHGQRREVPLLAVQRWEHAGARRV